jgi:hypothetical protein
VNIFIAGSLADALCVCGDYCDEIGLCVTVTSTTYVYTGGAEEGVIIGLINYPRFPATPKQIEEKAIELGWWLLEGLGQESFSVQTPETTHWFSMREADLAIAAGTRSAETRSKAQSEGCQSVIAQKGGA